MVSKEAEFNVEQHIKSPPGGLLGNFFIAEKRIMDFSLIEMLGKYLRKYGVQNRHVVFNIFIFKQNEKLTKFKIIFLQTFLMFKMFDDNCLFQISKKYDWVFNLKEIISLYVSAICIVSYSYKNKQFDQAIILLILHTVSFSLYSKQLMGV